MSENLKAVNEAFEDITDSLEDYSKQMIDDAAHLGPDVKYQTKLEEWNDLVADTYSSDIDTQQEAMNKLPGLSSELLSLAEQSMTSESEYNQIWSAILSQINESSDLAEDQITQSEDELDDMQKNWNQLFEDSITTQATNAEILTAQNTSLGEIVGLNLKIDGLAKSTDFNEFFINYNDLFGADSPWITALKT